VSQAPVTFPFVARFPALGPAGLAPLLPVLLEANSQAVSLHGLLDTGAASNILPYSAGVALGFDWRAQRARVPVGGLLSGVEGRLVLVSLTVLPFAPISMPFTWVDADTVPLLLGQMTFFHEFDVCFFRRRGLFQIDLAQGP
jgi:hypothetical protein